MRAKPGIFLLCIAIMLNLTPCPSTAKAAGNGKAVIIVLDRAGLSDIIDAEAPNLDMLMANGTIGLMTTNTGGSRSQRDSYITIGAGTRAIGSDKSEIGLQADETYQGTSAADIFLQASGISVSPSAVVNLGIAQAVRNNMNKPYQVTIGALGTALREAGLKTAVAGNCDTPHEYKRFLSSLLMDDKGIIPMGFVDRSLLTADNTRPYGIKTDYDELGRRIDEIWDMADVIAIQLGDTSRAEDFRYEAPDELNTKYKLMAINESDSFIGRVLKKLDLDNDLLMIITPLGPARDLAANNRMTPVIFAGRGFSAGLACSASTRRPGIITNLDIGATLLDYYKIPHRRGQIGSAAYTSDKKMSPEELRDFNIRLTEIYNQRNFLLRSYIYILVIVIILALAGILLGRKYLKYFKASLLFLMSVPIAYLLLTLFHRPTLIGSFIVSWSMAFLITLLIFAFRSGILFRIMLICLSTAALIITDQLTGARLIQGSPLGYDVISAARFYGIGNEYMGVLVAAACTGCGALYDICGGRRRKISVPVIVIILFFTAFVLAHPGIGANVGGTISALTAIAALAVLFKEGRFKVWHVLAAGASIVILVSGLFVLDGIRSVSSQSHMGQTTALIRQNGFIELFNIMKRKIEMNIKLFRYTIWTRVFLLSLISVITLIFRPLGTFRDIKSKYPKTVHGISAAIIGSIAALLANDSGIVAAATAMIFIAPPIILIVIEKLLSEDKRAVREDGI